MVDGGRSFEILGQTDHVSSFFDNADFQSTPSQVVRDTATSFWSSFRLVTEAEVRRIITSSPVKSCSLDAMPTFLIREFVDLVTPYVTVIAIFRQKSYFA